MSTPYRENSENKEETLAPYSKEERSFWDEIYLACARAGNGPDYCKRAAKIAIKERRELFGRQD